MEGKFGAVIVAAGSSRRMGGQGSKVLEDLGGKPVLLYSFQTLASSPWVGELAVVCREEDRPQVEALLAEGLSPGSTAMQAIGYKEAAAALRGDCSREEAIETIKRETRRYAKRQLTWLRSAARGPCA